MLIILSDRQISQLYQIPTEASDAIIFVCSDGWGCLQPCVERFWGQVRFGRGVILVLGRQLPIGDIGHLEFSVVS